LRNSNEHEEMITEVSLQALAPNPYQIRAIDASDPSLKELAESIRKTGLIELPIIRQTVKGYEIATGHRRVFCCRNILGLKTIKCMLRPLTDEQMAEVILEENLKRQALNPIEEARGYANFRDQFNWSEQRIATRFNRTRDLVAQRLRLLTFQKPIQDAVAQGLLTVSHAEAVAMAPVHKQEQLVQLVVERKVSVRETTDMANELVNRERANREALENIALRLQSLDMQVANLYQVIARHEPLMTLFQFHQHSWKADSCVHSVNGICRAFEWNQRPSWIERLQGVKFEKLENGHWHVQACGLVCASCNVYQRRTTSS